MFFPKIIDGPIAQQHGQRYRPTSSPFSANEGGDSPGSFDWWCLEGQGWRQQWNRHCRLKAKAGCTLPFRKVQPPSK